MSLFSGRYLVGITLLLLVLLFIIGVFAIKARPHGCLDDDHFIIAPKVEVFQWGSFHIYTYPIKHDCPLPSQYDPKVYTQKGNYTP